MDCVNQVCTFRCHIDFPEIKPLISGDPSALLEKLIIDAVVSACFRYCEDAADSNWEATPASLARLACRLNAKYQVFLQIS